MITVVDLFAGAGGSSLGATLAGCKVVWAGNHWPTAVAVHTANFPGAEHVCQDLRQFNFASLPDHDLLSASPACQGHAKARGKDRGHVHDDSRATAWAGYDPMVYRSTLGDFEHYFVQAQGHGSILNRENQSRAVAYVQRNPGWRLSVQAHKILNIP
jgi:hypothetical protein